MALTVIDFPEDVAPGVEITWEMDTNHSRQVNPYSGVDLAVRGLKERWRFSMRIKDLTREQAQQLQGFFLRLEGNLHCFRMRDPSQPKILGNATTNPVLAINHFARDRVVSVSGWGTLTPALKAGDWIHLPSGQVVMVTTDVNSVGGTTQIPVWPMLWQNETAGGTVRASANSPAYGIYYLDQGLPGWTASVANKERPYKSALTGAQVVLQETVSYP